MTTLNINQRQMARNAINLAKRELEKGDYDSTSLANYILRDLDATKEAGLTDLARAMHRDGCLHKNDVLGLIEHLEIYLDREEQQMTTIKEYEREITRAHLKGDNEEAHRIERELYEKYPKYAIGDILDNDGEE